MDTYTREVLPSDGQFLRCTACHERVDRLLVTYEDRPIPAGVARLTTTIVVGYLCSPCQHHTGAHWTLDDQPFRAEGD